MKERRPGRPAIVLGILIMAAAVIAGLSSVVVFGNALGPAFQNAFVIAPYTAPVSTSVELTPGTWAVYSIDATAVQGGGVTAASYRTSMMPTALSAFDVTVTGPDGKQLVLKDATLTSTDTITRANLTFTADLSFDVKQRGIYRVVVANNNGTQLIMAPALANIGTFMPWGAVAGIGASAFAFLGGLIVLILGIVGSARARRPATTFTTPMDQGAPGSAGPVDYSAPASSGTTAGGLPPPGWYPDPMRSANWRYWDGLAWTAHTG